MNAYWQQARTWFFGLDTRERWLVGAGGALLFITLLYILAIEPFVQSKSSLADKVANREADLAWMQQTLPRIQNLRGNAQTLGTLQGSLLAAVDASAKKNGLGNAIRTIQQDNNGRAVRIRLEAASFDAIVRWLNSLRSTYGVTVESISIDQGDAPGTVNASLTLQQP
ncbi:MAG TPA: type II secretion system protein M [Gammaproteobacteria bacterium]|nr:type II secretion system protein M [Gammaproteobacteria bacterium]